jgi:hypothetical protein
MIRRAKEHGAQFLTVGEAVSAWQPPIVGRRES